MSADWQPGDLALCVNASPHPRWGNAGLRRGHIYTVAELRPVEWHPLFGEGIGLEFVELVSGALNGFSCHRFRKIRPHTPDAEDRETIALLNGKPVPVEA